MDSNGSTFTVVTAQADVLATISDAQLLTGEVLSAEITVTNLDSQSGAELTLAAWIEGTDQDIETWSLSLAVGESQTTTYQGVPQAEGAGLLRFVVIDDSINGTYVFAATGASFHVHHDDVGLPKNGWLGLGERLEAGDPRAIAFETIDL